MTGRAAISISAALMIAGKCRDAQTFFDDERGRYRAIIALICVFIAIALRERSGDGLDADISAASTKIIRTDSPRGRAAILHPDMSPRQY